MDNDPRRVIYNKSLPPDPWARFSAWRHNGPLSKANNIRVRTCAFAAAAPVRAHAVD